MRDERPHALRDLGIRHAPDRREPCADEAVIALLVDDVRSVRERVQAEGIEVEVAAVLRVAGEDAGVPVPMPGKAAIRISSTSNSFSESSSARDAARSTADLNCARGTLANRSGWIASSCCARRRTSDSRAGNRRRRRCTAGPDRDQREGSNQEQPGQRDHAASSSSRTQSDQREEVLRALDAEAEQEVVEEVVVRARVRRLDLPVLLELRGDLLAEPLDVLNEHLRRHEPADEEA